MSENQVFHLWRRAMRPVLPLIYVEDPTHQIRVKFASDKVYAQAIELLIIVCTDAAVINRARGTIFLARRRVFPMQGLWWIGGKRCPGESPGASICRCFMRETGIALSEDRFEFIGLSEHVWSRRKQPPQDQGVHYLSFAYAVELTDEELAYAATHLDPDEYDRSFGLKEFTRDDLVAAGVHPVILDFYDAVFGATAVK